MSKILLVSDLHFSSRPQDDHFWDLFRQIDEAVGKFNIDMVYCLGDITTAKNNHPAELVNRVVEGFAEQGVV